MKTTDYSGQIALVTGASSGIGVEFAERLAAQGADLILTARREDRLNALAEKITAEHGVAVHVIAADLGAADGAKDLLDRIDSDGLAVDILINNAGFGDHGDLVGADPDLMAAMVRLNVEALTYLTARVLPPMVERDRGVIINVASTAAFQPVPHMATYAATKAYVLSFTQALWSELRRTNVKALALCPGATDTEFFDIAGDDAAVGARRSTADVIDTAMRALKLGRPSAVDGWRNAVMAAAAGRAPVRATLAIAGSAVAPKGE